MRTQATYAWWSFQPQQKSKLPGLLIFLGAAGLAWWWFSRPPEMSEPPAQDWNGVWQNGSAIIRVRGTRGEYSPDGMSVIPFRAKTQGDNLWFPARVAGRLFTFCLMRKGETARLVGTPEYEAERGPPGTRKPTDNKEKKNAQEALLPVDMGMFRRQ
jgi:hypothetical protein